MTAKHSQQGPKMTIGYDAKRAACNKTGLGNYSRYVLGMMGLQYPDNRYLLYTPKVSCPDRLEPLLAGGNMELRQPGAMGRALGPLWRSLEIPRLCAADGVDLYHGLSNELPLNINRWGVTSVVTIHDVIWRRTPGDYAAIDRAIYDKKYGHSARIADRVIAISECTKRDLVNDFQIDPAKIDVIYQGCDPLFFNPVSKEVREAVVQRHGLPERYILSVGTVQGRKNQLLAVKALRGLPDDVVLAIAGGRDKAYGAQIDQYIAKHRLHDRVRWLGAIHPDDLPALYAGAKLSSYTSRYEGFGIPLVESLAAGTPVLACTGSCLEEAGGKGGVYVDPDDIDAYVYEAGRLLDQPWLRERLVRDGQKHIKRFNGADFAKATMQTYMKALLA